uniref:Cytochrome P450 n=1 Tax=Chromera velia CCMP2878 TaxID=1169474 RepID=A0A0G4HYB7_9ALVE|eukprot:Cvel_9452.t1-p1 / transcript=Cvel_9452.t1 / gene=Cvel_9452 / organism=Chromera_velia_CCMP2878 / gene_product=Probable cytochrome P450 6t1, putative / transcript_product=Probable cytochrome P450 6t1, putative / location=Cvel_scaffold545:44094-48719(-) / protein_length=619 / sequence_SO=supercontig / SO=protein_coding / is_pseudo=false
MSVFSLILPHELYSLESVISSWPCILVTGLCICFLSLILHYRLSFRNGGIPVLRLTGPNNLLNVKSTTELLEKVKEASIEQGGIVALELPFGLKSFVCVSSPELVQQVLVPHNAHFTKAHAFGVLETFRRTSLRNGQQEAWQVVHQIAGSLLKRGRNEFQLEFDSLFEQFLHEEIDQTEVETADEAASLSTSPTAHSPVSPSDKSPESIFVERTRTQMTDFALQFRVFYWKVVLLMVVGTPESYETATETERKEVVAAFRDLPGLYSKAWQATIDQIDDPRALGKTANREESHDLPKSLSLSTEDAAEVVLEFLFTGAASVSTTFLWTLWHLSQSKEAQEVVRADCEKGLGGSKERAVGLDETSRLVWVEAALRETLRMYPPIHVGRKVREDHELSVNLKVPNEGGGRKGVQEVRKVYALRKGADLFTNPWFVHRNSEIWQNPDLWDPCRFVPEDRKGDVVRVFGVEGDRRKNGEGYEGKRTSPCVAGESERDSKGESGKPDAADAESDERMKMRKSARERTQGDSRYFPFSLGKRGCPGYTLALPLLKSMLARLLLRFDVRPSSCPSSSSSLLGGEGAVVKGEGQLGAAVDINRGPVCLPSLMLPLTPSGLFLEFVRR